MIIGVWALFKKFIVFLRASGSGQALGIFLATLEKGLSLSPTSISNEENIISTGKLI